MRYRFLSNYNYNLISQFVRFNAYLKQGGLVGMLLLTQSVAHMTDSILATLESIIEGDDKAKAMEANGIFFQIHTIKFIFLLVVFMRILSYTKRLSDQLQCKDIDMAKAVELVSGTVEILNELRDNEERWGQIVKCTKDFAELHDIDITSSIRPRRRRVVPRRLEDDIIMETTGVREHNSTYDQLKTSLYLPIIDCMLFELNQRFTSHNLDIMRAIQSCYPQSSSFLDPQKLVSIIDAL